MIVRGMTVGSVSSLSLVPGGVNVIARIWKPIFVREGYTVTIVASSAFGGRHMDIYEGGTNGSLISLDTTLEGTPPKNIMKEASELISSIRNTLVDEGVLDNLQTASIRIANLTDRIDNGEGSLGKLLSSDSSLYDDIASLADNLRKVSVRLENGEGMIGRLLSSDDTLYKDITASIASFREIAGRIEEGKGSIGALLSDDSALYDEITATISNIKTVSQSLANGEGLLGQLLSKDSSMTGEVEGLLHDARATIDDYRESSPVVTFTSIFFGAF